MASKLSAFLSELKRRKVFQVAGIYVAGALGVWGAADFAFPALNVPEAGSVAVLILTIAGFPVALILAWLYRVKPEDPGAGIDTPGPVANSSGRGVKKSIVVLPFDNMSPDEKDAYFADGLTEEIITKLSHIRSLRVISRSSAYALKSREEDVRTIGKELEVQFVLEGSVRRAGNDLLVTAQLIDAQADEHLWAKKYDGVLEDVFSIQEELSQAIVEGLSLSLSTEEEEHLADRPIEDVQAYDCYLMAWRDICLGDEEGLERGHRYLKRGMEIVGENVLLLRGLAEMHLQAYESGVKADEETLTAAEAIAERITALSPDSPDCHYLPGRIERFRGSTIDSIDHFERALAIDPNHTSSILFLFVAYALHGGRGEETRLLRMRILERDPFNYLVLFAAALDDWASGRLGEALKALDAAGEVMGGERLVDLFKAKIRLWQGKKQEAMELLGPLIQPGMQPGLRGLISEWADFLRHCIEGNPDQAGQSLSDYTRTYLWNDPEFPWLGAASYALAGEKETALDWLEHAVDRGWINYPLFAERDPLLASLRGEPRFAALMERVKPEWEALGRRPELKKWAALD